MRTHRILFPFILFFYTFNSSAQSYFIKGLNQTIQGNGNFFDISIHDTNSFTAVGGDILPLQKGLVFRFDNSGNTIQTLTVDSMLFTKILKTNDNSFLIVGHSINNCCTYYCTKTDSAFNIAWTKRLPAEPYIIKEFKSQYYFFTQYSFGINLITKTDTTGIVISQKLLEDNTFSYKYFIDDAALTTDDNIMITGRREVSNPNQHFNFILAKMDTSLNIIWMKELNGFYDNYPSRITKSYDSTLIVSGIFAFYPQPFFIGQIKIDNNGSVLLSRFNKPMNLNNQIGYTVSNLVLPNYDNLVGCSILEPTADQKPMIVKYDSTLNYISSFKYEFINSFGVATNNFLSQINSNRFYLIGTTSEFGFPSHQILMGLDTTLQSCISQPFPMLDTLVTLTPLIISFSQPAYTTSNLQDTILTFQIYSVTPYDYCQFLSVETIEQPSNYLNVYPNPITNGNFSISYLLPQNKESILEIYDINGKKIVSQLLGKFSTIQNFYLPKLANGIYLARIKSGNYSETKKVVVNK